MKTTDWAPRVSAACALAWVGCISVPDDGLPDANAAPTQHQGETSVSGAVDAGSTHAPDATSSTGSTPLVDAGSKPPALLDAAVISDAASAVDTGVKADAQVEAGLPMTAASACTGKPGMRHGKSNQTLSVAGVRRSFIYYAPAGLDPNQPVPLVIIPHGTNMSGQGMFDITGYSALADRDKFIAIFPDGIDGPGSLAPWNVGDSVCGLGAFVAGAGQDQAFVDELIKFAGQDQCLDERHIFMTGFSMGGYFSHETGCTNSKIAAIGPHSAGTHDLSKCSTRHKPVIMFHFKTDSLIDYDCGVGARDQWIKRNGCSASTPDVVTVKGGKCEYYKGCPVDGQVAFCAFEGPSFSDDGLPSGHGWSGGAKKGDESFGAITGSENASELGWAFFKKYAW